MKKLTFFGGTGGLGKGVCEILSKQLDVNAVLVKDNEISLLPKYEVTPVGSKDLDLGYKINYTTLGQFFEKVPTEIAVIFSNYNFNSFIHKYNDKGDFCKLDNQVDINIAGITKLISFLLGNMRKQKYGRIIIASSITADSSVVGAGVYAASKAYHENLVKTIAIENASLGITANCIQLGYMDGGLTYTLPEEFMQKKIQEIPAKRLGSVKEIANAIDFLIGNEYVNGSTLKLTGGL